MPSGSRIIGQARNPSLRVVVLMAAWTGYASAKPVSQTIGEGWKTACPGQPQYSCCKGKETDCNAGCQSGSTCGAACTNCKNSCGASYSACIAKSVVNPGGGAIKAPPATQKAQ
jgi:hypothetical protein